MLIFLLIIYSNARSHSKKKKKNASLQLSIKFFNFVYKDLRLIQRMVNTEHNI